MFRVDMFFFCFFKQKTAYEMRISDWSSDVCSSDLVRTSRHHPHRRDRPAARPQPASGDARNPERQGRRHDRAGNAGGIHDEGPPAAPRDGGGGEEGGLTKALSPWGRGRRDLRTGSLVAAGESLFRQLRTPSPSRSEEHKSEHQSTMRISY